MFMSRKNLKAYSTRTVPRKRDLRTKSDRFSLRPISCCQMSIYLSVIPSALFAAGYSLIFSNFKIIDVELKY